jgi:hypothetical protein
MPATSINTNAKGCLLLIIPTALTISALFIAWPFILGLAILITGGSIWQSYQWSKTVQSIDPVFQAAIVENRGQISPIDLSLKANISGALAKTYLDAKADEFGTRPRQHPERGAIYYFVSMSTLGSIFDDIEAEEVRSEIPAAATTVALPSGTPTITTPPPTVELPPIEEPPTVEEQPIVETSTPIVSTSTTSPLSNLGELLEEEVSVAEPPHQPTVTSSDQPRVTIIQSELAKRLDVHSSTVYKRRSDPDFTEWTRSRDPEGLAWAYSSESKEYFLSRGNSRS